ncbi:hypothetical protein JHK86_057296 (mitochondrion) [Glycine max]|nr:hypothetical protein JHK86_057296 [Glycine max]
MNCRVDRSDPDAAVAPRRYGLDPLLPTPGHHSMSGIRGDILDVTTPLGAAVPPCLSIDTQLSRPITNATGVGAILADKAATKAMPVNRVGDFGLAPGISGRFTLFQTVDFSTIFARASAPRNSWISCNMRLNAITLICILLLIGAVGKSAQIGSHTWSPDAMEGPTPSLVRRLAFYLGNQALSRLLLQRGCSVGLTVAIAVLFGDTPSVGNNMMDPSGSSGSSGGGGSESSWTGALLSSETLSGTGSVNQPAEGMPVPPANPVVEQAGPANPEDTTEIIGGDSIDSIRNRLLQSYGNPSAEQISRASYDADDLFQVKVEIIRGMTPLDPEGDWPGRGARALDNPRTSTGEDSLENLYRLKDDLNENGRDSETFKRLKDKVFRRPRPLEDANSTT